MKSDMAKIQDYFENLVIGEFDIRLLLAGFVFYVSLYKCFLYILSKALPAMRRECIREIAMR